MKTEPNALTAALQGPPFVTKGAGLAMHVANRHVERWAPEDGAGRSRPLRNLGFVDRLVAPWIESAQRSSSLRMFSQYMSSGVGERPASAVSWVFPRPWYQDELDWMAAARQVGTQTMMEQASAPSLLTTRGTYVAPAQAHAAQIALPSALFEYVAPSLSVARPDAPNVGDSFSPLVPFAAIHAAQVMARAVAPLIGSQQTSAAARMSPGLRSVLTTMLERSARHELAPTRSSSYAPELVTPPAPRADATPSEGGEVSQATQVAERYAEQHAHIVELQRVARAATEREYATREATRVAESREPRAATEQRQAEIQQKVAELTTRRDVERTAASDAAAVERQRIEERIAQRIAERTAGQRLHEQSRDAAARDARVSPVAPISDARREELQPTERRIGAELAAAVAALPPELATMIAAGIGQRPERAALAIAEVGEALRAIELIARNTGAIEPTRGPRLVMPVGLGGLVSTIERTQGDRAQPRMPMVAPPVTPARTEMRVPAMSWLAADPGRATAFAPTSALGAASSTKPAALQHIAWSDRWLARFAGARPQSLDVLSVGTSSPETRMQLLAAAAPHVVFVAPMFDDKPHDVASASDEVPAAAHALAARHAEPLPTLRAQSSPVIRYADDAETPDDVLVAIAASARQSRTAPTAPTLPKIEMPAYEPRDTLADLVAHGVPSAPGAGLSAQLASSPFAAALRHVLPLGVAPTFDVRALFGGLSTTYLAGLLESSTNEIAIASQQQHTAGGFEASREVSEWQPTYVAPEAQPDGEIEHDRDERVEQAQVAYSAPLTTLRSALLLWDVETLSTEGTSETRFSAPSMSGGGPLARTMIESLTLPMLAHAAVSEPEPGSQPAYATSYAAPGMIADRAQAWSVAQERSASDLSFDFVTPELVLAARVYGLGPAEAAQAARLAISGPGQLTAMAGAVDRTFVQAMAIEAERRGERARAISTAFPLAASDVAGSPGRPTASHAAASRDEATSAYQASSYESSGSVFGVERRTPRGAFLWPAATTAALGLTAAAFDGEQSMSVAALELLAAQAVAELGTYTALADFERTAFAGERGGSQASSEPRDEDVLTTATALVPSVRREKFQSLYVALSQSPSGRNWSPAARAARALALAGRGDESITARERASVAWDVLPVVYGMTDDGGEAGTSTVSTGEAAVSAMRRRDELRKLDPAYVDSRPGLSALSMRAGEALGSYVAPSASASAMSSGSSSSSSSQSSSSSSAREQGAVLRAPTAAQEMVQTGRPAGRFGGGEVEIPSWFEQAARKMFDDRSSGMSDGISLAELTYVTAAPATQIAASSRGAAATSTPSVAPSSGVKTDKPEDVNIEKIANEVYREILVLMDTARSRNGEPYL